MKKFIGNPAPPLEPGVVHFWLFDLDELTGTHPSWKQILSAEEITRSNRYIFEKDRLRFVARRGILRQLLARYSGLKPAEIRYNTNPYGKPSLPSHLLFFNLSTSQNRIAFVFTLEKDIGVDIEQVRPLPDLSQLAELCFSLEEQSSLSALAPNKQVDAFFHIWTQKEAFIKAVGEGLSRPLRDFSVSVDPDRPGRLLTIKESPVEASHWKMYTNNLEEGWRAAVCVRAEVEPEVRQFKAEVAGFLGEISKE